MIIRYPNYYKDFRCLGSKCRDNCCIGWEIDIDEDTLEKYKKIGGDLGDSIQKNISLKGTPHFILCADERCPFLNDENLCDIFIELGEESLCTICTEHPRFNNWFGGIKETGLGMCCEEAVRILFEYDEPFKLICRTDGDEACFDENTFDGEWFSALEYARKTVFFIIQNKEYRLPDKMRLILTFSQDLQNMSDADDADGIIDAAKFYADKNNYENLLGLFSDFKNKKTGKSDLLRQWIEVYFSLENLDPHWREVLQSIDIDTDYSLKAAEDEIVPERLLIYFLYRYFLLSYYDGDVSAKVKLALLGALFLNIIFCSRAVSRNTAEQMQLIKMYAKEIEYCEENLDKLYEEFWTEDCFGVSAFTEIIDGLKPN